MGYSVIDLFCGCGGLTCGFIQAGFDILAGVDTYKPSLATFAVNFPKALALEADISVLDPKWLRERLGLKQGELDCLIGGPPCQGYSKNVPAAQRTLNDPRNLLMQVYLTFVKELQPKVLLIENVAELVNAYDQTVTQSILSELCAMGYTADVQALNAAHYGVPQLRRRAFFLASKAGPIVFPFPTHTAKLETHQALSLFIESQKPLVNVWEAICDLRDVTAGKDDKLCAYSTAITNDFQQAIRGEAQRVADHQVRALTQIQMDRIACLGEGQGIKHLPDHLRPKSGYSGAYARLYPDEPARTITKWVFHPGSGRFIHPYDNRVITIREAARLQAFPDWFTFTGTYIQKSHQVGEAVPPLLVKKLAHSLAAAL